MLKIKLQEKFVQKKFKKHNISYVKVHFKNNSGKKGTELFKHPPILAVDYLDAINILNWNF